MFVQYAPTSTGAQTSGISLSYFDGLFSQTSMRTLNGNAVTPANLGLSDGPSYDFGSQPIGLAVSKTFTLTNSGGFAASAISGSGLSAPFNFNGGAYPGTGGTCAGTLAPAGTCTIVVVYQAVAATGSAATMSNGYTDGNTTQTSTRDLTGTGVTPANISISDGPVFDYGLVAQGATSDQIIHIDQHRQLHRRHRERSIVRGSVPLQRWRVSWYRWNLRSVARSGRDLFSHRDFRARFADVFFGHDDDLVLERCDYRFIDARDSRGRNNSGEPDDQRWTDL